MTVPTTNQGLVLPVTGDLNAVPTHLAAYNAGVENRLVQRFNSAVDRSVRNPTPNEGELSYLADTNIYEWFNGSSWQTLLGSGPWTAYTPAWGVTSGTASTIGTGTLAGRYQQIGKTVHFVAQITMGATTTYSTGQWTLSLPVPALTSVTIRQVIQGRVFDASPASAWSAQSWIIGDGSVMTLEAQGPTDVQALRQGFPITFATGDSVTYQGTYEAA